MSIFKSFTLVIATVIVLSGSWINPSTASTLSSADDAFFGVGSVTFDSATGLEWLDLTLSTNRSFFDISQQFGTGGDFEGWDYATTSQVIRYFDNAGIRNTLIGVLGEEALSPRATFDPIVGAFMDLAGRTSIDSTVVRARGIFDDSQFVDNVGFASASDFIGILSGDNFAPKTAIVTNAFSPSSARSSTGSFLVRDAAVIPLPAAFPLYGTGLAVMGFIGWRRKRQALRT